MCVAALAWRTHPRWRLLAIGNRDEFHDRPAAALAPWDDGSGIVAGRDLQSGGTWLGINPARGSFAVVTNVRDPLGSRAAKPSRGALVRDLLTGEGRHADPDAEALAAFNPFNLLLASSRSGCDGQLEFLTNRPVPIRRALAPGVYGLSNGALDQPWPKTLALKAAATRWLDEDRADFAPLWAILACERLPDDAIGPLRESGVAGAFPDPSLTPPFLRSPRYGTRCSTIVTIDHTGTSTIAERRFDAEGRMTGETALTFASAGAANTARA